jgi:endonuclease-3 related protein
MDDELSDPSGPITPGEIYAVLHAHYGDLEWWPAQGAFQVMVGAVLTQRTAWRNVEMAMERLEEAGIDGIDPLMALSAEELEPLIRSSGTYVQKARCLMALFAMVQRTSDGSLETFLAIPRDQLRSDLLSVKGIGPETADSIILYAAKQPVFVVDAYTRRILGRIGIEAAPSYDEVATWFTKGIEADAGIYNNYHAALVELAKGFCQKVPRCEGCPLQTICPTGRGTRLGQ